VEGEGDDMWGGWNAVVRRLAGVASASNSLESLTSSESHAQSPSSSSREVVEANERDFLISSTPPSPSRHHTTALEHRHLAGQVQKTTQAEQGVTRLETVELHGLLSHPPSTWSGS
jgi:hypothetical protein